MINTVVLNVEQSIAGWCRIDGPVSARHLVFFSFREDKDASNAGALCNQIHAVMRCA